MKKITLAILVALVIFISGCSSTPANSTDDSSNKDNIVVSNNDNAGETEDTSSDTSEETVSCVVTYSNVAVEYGILGPEAYVIIEYENTGNVPLFFSTCNCDIEDETGALIATEGYITCYPQVLAPEEKGYVYFITDLEDGDATKTLSAKMHLDYEKSVSDPIRYPLSDITIKNDDFYGVKAIGRIENNTTETLSSLSTICVIAFDADGNPLCVLDTYSSEVAPGDKVGFEAGALLIQDGITADAVASFVAYAYPYSYNW